MSVVSLFCLLQMLFGQVQKLPEELLLWEETSPQRSIQYESGEKTRSETPPDKSPSGLNRVFSYVDSPTYSIHRPENPNGVGLVICPGGGYRDVWLDREGHDLGILLKEHNITSLVLKYRTNSGDGEGRTYSWEEYIPEVLADARQAIRILRKNSGELGLDPGKIGICGFSAGGNLALISTLYLEENRDQSTVSGMPDFAGLFYPWFRDDYSEIIEDRSVPNSQLPKICPIFIMNARDDRLTPANRCVDFYSQILAAGVETELHVYSKGSHGFDLGVGRGESAQLWPQSFAAWMRDLGIIPD